MGATTFLTRNIVDCRPVRAATSLQSFRRAVKTTLFQAAFTDTDSVFSL